MTTTVRPEGKKRADKGVELLKELGLNPGEAFFEHGTEMMAVGDQVARRARDQFLKLATTGEAMDRLADAVQAENRIDHTVDLGDMRIGRSGLVMASDVDGARLEFGAEPVGWQRLSSYAPASIPPALRSNVNLWLGSRAGDKAVLRSRRRPQRTADGALIVDLDKPRTLYSVVSERYVRYDLDQIANDIREIMPTDSRARVRYDGSRSRVDVILQSPHHFEGGKAGTVGEPHRLMLRITSADDGSAGFKLNWAMERIRCINCTLLRDKRVIFHARHTQANLIEVAREALGAQGAALEHFATMWRSAWTDFYIDRYTKDKLSMEEAVRRIVYHGLARAPFGTKDDQVKAILAAAEAEEADDSRAAIHNAITRAAHEGAWTSRSAWVDDELEEQAADLLYVKNVLLPIPDDDREKLGW